MSILSNLKTDSTIEDEKDVIGGGGVWDSGIYNTTVALAYVTLSSKGATGLVVHLKDENGRELRQTLWMTSGKDKGGNNFYVDRNGDKKYLPGFIAANSLCLLTVGKEISDMDTEQKVVNLYSFEAKKEVPTKVDVLTELLGKEIIAGVIKQIVDKNVKDASGAYVPSGETREENEIDKFFRARDRMTTAEIRAQADEAVFIDTWENKWKGQVRNRAKGAADGNAGTPGAPAAAVSSKPKTSLFAS